MSRTPPVRPPRVVDPVDRSAHVARALAGVAPGVVTAALCALALLTATVRTLVPSGADAAPTAARARSVHVGPSVFAVLTVAGHRAHVRRHHHTHRHRRSS